MTLPARIEPKLTKEEAALNDASISVVHLLRFPRDHLFSIERVFATVRAALPQDIRSSVWSAPNVPNSIKNWIVDAMAVRRLDADVLHITGDAHYLTWLLDPARTVLTIHDVESLDRMRGVKQMVFRWLWFTLPVRNSGTVVVISEATREALAKHVDLRGKRVEVIPDPIVATVGRKQAPFNSQRPTILHIGTKANKNLARHIQALDGLNVRLIVIGKLTDADRALLETSGLEWENRFNLTDDELAAAYVEADLLLFASLIEGFGLPILEAQSAGIPVITSNVSAMPETAGNGAEFVDPHSVVSIRQGVERVISDESLRERAITAGFANLERFAPHRVAGQYAAVYRSLITGRQ